MEYNNIIILTALVFITLLFIYCSNNYEEMINIPKLKSYPKWKTDPKCKYVMMKIYLDILKKHKIKKSSKDDDWILYFPCSYSKNKKELKRLSPSNKNQRIFIVSNSVQIGSKSHLWKNLVSKYGRNVASKIAPMSYTLGDEDELRRLKAEHKPGKLYIMKKNIQRQEGLKITNNLKEITNGYSNSYVVVQELLQNPYLINSRKINMRFYVLFICQNNEVNVYVHDNGFMYYTKDPFKKGSLETGPNITTGYIERSVYETNPLTHKDFQKYLDNPQRCLTNIESMYLNSGVQLSRLVFNRIYTLITRTCQAYEGVMCQGSRFEENITFQLFGVDIAVNDKLEPQIIEFNIGPNLATFDDQDKKIKYKAVEDILKLLKIIPRSDHSYIRLI